MIEIWLTLLVVVMVYSSIEPLKMVGWIPLKLLQYLQHCFVVSRELEPVRVLVSVQ